MNKNVREYQIFFFFLQTQLSEWSNKVVRSPLWWVHFVVDIYTLLAASSARRPLNVVGKSPARIWLQSVINCSTTITRRKMMNFSKSFIHYSKVFQSGPTNEANVLIEIKYDVGKTTADGRAAHSQIWLKKVQKVHVLRFSIFFFFPGSVWYWRLAISEKKMTPHYTQCTVGVL